jgi:hypothetical protein
VADSVNKVQDEVAVLRNALKRNDVYVCWSAERFGDGVDVLVSIG